VFEPHAGSLEKKATVLKPSGHLSHIMNHGTDSEGLRKLQAGGGPSASMTLVKPNGAQLQEIFELIAAGKVKLEVAKVRWWLMRADQHDFGAGGGGGGVGGGRGGGGGGV
jgi:hypothetical protein